MTKLEDEIRTALRTKAQALRVPEPPALDRDIVDRRQPLHRWLLQAACLVLIASGIVALTLLPGGDAEPDPLEASNHDPMTLAKGEDAEISGFSQLNGHTLSVEATLQDGVVTGAFQTGNVTVMIQCSGTRSIQDDLILAGVVIDNADGLATLDDVTVAVGDLLALIIREKPEHVGQRVTLYQYGAKPSDQRACNELVDSVPENLDGGFFDGVKFGDEIETLTNQD
jgi:hypothetical protein